MSEYTSIILIGPIGTGKSTLGGLIAERTGLPRCSLDHVRFGYYQEIGYDEEHAKSFMERMDFWGLLHYWKPFEAYSVERVLADYPNHVIDFGGGQSVYEDEALFARVENALRPYPNVVLILPSPDVDESYQILRSRKPGSQEEQSNPDESGTDKSTDVNYHFLTNPSNRKLAKIVVYSKGQTPAESCEAILQALSRDGVLSMHQDS